MRSAKRGFTLIELLVATVVVGAVIIAGMLALGRVMVDKGDAVKAAEAAGFTEVRIVKRHNVLVRYRGCGANDDIAFDLTAKDAAGKPADVKVCCGAWYKGCTVRAH